MASLDFKRKNHHKYKEDTSDTDATRLKDDCAKPYGKHGY
jgi:hypothetical protein